MSYHIDDTTVGLDWLEERLRTTDLIPSQKPLLDGLPEKLSALAEAGIETLGDLRAALKTEKALMALSQASGVQAGYLQSLRRAIEGFFPKPKPIKDMDWLEQKMVAGLDKLGIRNTRQLFEAAFSAAQGLRGADGLDKGDLTQVVAISDLCRIQWVSPNFARVLVAAGFADAAAIAGADPDLLFDAITRANQGGRYYKGKVGLRDVRRLVAAAAYVP